MSEIPAEVFGWGREMAAGRAISELANARAAYERNCHGWSDYDCKATRQRLKIAEAVRKQYSDY